MNCLQDHTKRVVVNGFNVRVEISDKWCPSEISAGNDAL